MCESGEFEDHFVVEKRKIKKKKKKKKKTRDERLNYDEGFYIPEISVPAYYLQEEDQTPEGLENKKLKKKKRKKQKEGEPSSRYYDRTDDSQDNSVEI